MKTGNEHIIVMNVMETSINTHMNAFLRSCLYIRKVLWQLLCAVSENSVTFKMILAN
jgi:hypothetical protein